MSRAQAGLVIGVGAAGAKIAMVGVPVATLGTAALIASTGGAAAVVLAGFGAYKWLSKDSK